MGLSYEPTCRQMHFDSWPYDKPLANLRFGSDIPRGVVRWLWAERLPLGRIALLVGDPGVGKSLLLADIAARHSAGLAFPPFAREVVREGIHTPATADGVREGIHAPAAAAKRAVGDGGPTLQTPPRQRGGVLFISPEDGLSATLQPRLSAAGAELGNILTIDGVRADKYQERAELPFTLPEHFDLLEDALQPVPAPRLIVLDPFITLLSPQARTSGLVTVLRRLSLFAARHDAAIVLVAHLVKSSTLHVLYRVRGSLTIAGAARTALLLSADPLQPGRRVLSVVKSVYAAPPPPLAFDIVSHNPRDRQSAPRLEWLDPQGGQPLVRESLLAPLSDFSLRFPLVTNSPEAHSALHDACVWLLDFLAGGPREVQAVLSAGARDGHSRGTLLRAKRVLGLLSGKADRESAWQWALRDTV